MNHLLAAALALSCSAVAAQDAAVRADAPEVQAQTAEREVGRGIASWYGPRFHGRPTASGEKFDMNQLTAAHPTLPFGTIVRVKSLVNGRSVDVRINDRGPHIRQRVIDLSRAAAKALGVIDARTGTKPVVSSLPQARD
jgi:rare lipoprotein A